MAGLSASGLKTQIRSCNESRQRFLKFTRTSKRRDYQKINRTSVLIKTRRNPKRSACERRLAKQ